jgi:hypothetical protein
MTDIVTLVERLRADADRGWLHPGLAAEAADEIERLRAEFELFREAPSKLEVAQYEIERLRKAGYGGLHYDLAEAQRQEIERLRAALEIIAGRRQCLDNLMSHVDIAIAALEAKT